MDEEILFKPDEDEGVALGLQMPKDEHLKKTGYWGVVKGKAPEIDENKKDGQVIYEGVPLVQFENWQQAVASLFLARFSYGQIVELVPHVKPLAEPNLVRLIGNSTSKVARFEFIQGLTEHPPRKLFESEYIKLYQAVGRPLAKPKGSRIIALRTMIFADMHNLDQIRPPPRLTPVRVLDPKKIKEDIDNMDNRIAALQDKLEIDKAKYQSNVEKLDKIPEGINKKLLEQKCEIKLKKIEFNETILEKYINTRIGLNIKLQRAQANQNV